MYINVGLQCVLSGNQVVYWKRYTGLFKGEPQPWERDVEARENQLDLRRKVNYSNCQTFFFTKIWG